MEPTPEFHLFPLLPIEIRLKVWHFILYTPRTLFIDCRQSPIRRINPKIPRAVESYSSSTPVPALLHTNRESRHEALSFYSTSFVTTRSLIYTSFPYDTVQLSDHILVHLPKNALDNIRHMVLDVRDCAYFDFFNMDCLRNMSALENLELLFSERTELRSRDRGSQLLVKDFESMRRDFPEWNCPQVRVINKSTLELVVVIEGGAGIYLQDENE